MRNGNSEIFSAMMQASGLDFSAAADLLSVDRGKILVWFSGSEAPNQHAVWKLAEFGRYQVEVADEIADQWDKSGRPARIKYGVSVSDKAAKCLGWPSRAAQIAAVAMAQITLAPIIIDVVPMPLHEKDSANDVDIQAGQDHAA